MSAVALVACNQLFSIEEPTRSSSAANGGAGTLDGVGGSGGSHPTTETTTASGGIGGSDPSGTVTSNVGGAQDSVSSGGSGGDGTITGGATNDTTSGGGTAGSGGASSSGADTSTGGGTSMGGGTSVGGATENTSASMTVTTGAVDPPGPCEGEDLRGALLVEIPAGTGVIGNGDEEDNAFPIIHPEFDVFCIDETEVTVAQYEECVAEDDCDPPLAGAGECPEDPPREADYPIGCVDYERAADYCAWAGKRLPTEKEWEYAARGEEGRLYPWGDAALSETRLNWNGVVGATTRVKSYPDGATPEGVYDMAGNVWEWTSSTWCSDYSEEPEECSDAYVPRGGSYVSVDRHVSPSYRDGENEPDQRFGFRCAFGAGER